MPVKNKTSRFVGVEFELPIINANKAAVDFAVVHEMTKAFAQKFGFTKQKTDDEGNLCSVEDEVSGDSLSFDCSYNTAEFSFGRADSLIPIKNRFAGYYTFVRDILRKNGHDITGMGLNPYYRFNNIEPIPNGRYRMLLHHLNSYKKYQNVMLFHDKPYYGLIACSAQMHIDPDFARLPLFINTFNKLEPLKAILFANSPSDDFLCVRDYFWRESMHGFNPHNVDGWNVEISSAAEIVSYIRSMSLYCTERDGKYINFSPMTLDAYFGSETIDGEYFDGQTYRAITFAPQLSDLSYLRSFKFVDLTFRGTLELRSTCMQPVSEVFASSALNVGLAVNLEECARLLDQSSLFHKGYTPSELRRFFVRNVRAPFADAEELQSLLYQLLHVAGVGLQKRGFGEEILLQPLYHRVRLLSNPALQMISGIKNGKSLEDFIQMYGSLDWENTYAG